MKNKYFIMSACGMYSLVVNSEEELVFAAIGEYSSVPGFGYPSIIGDWFESNSDVYPWNLDTLESYEAKETLEWLREYKLPEIVNSDGTDASEIVKKYINVVVIPALTSLSEEE